MRKHFILLLMTAVFLLSCFVSVGQVLTANLTTKRSENFPSAYMRAGNIDVWLTNGYNTENKYAVLYMHNIQKKLDSTTTWNNPQGVDESLSKLFAENNFSEKPLKYISDANKTVHFYTKSGNGQHRLLQDGRISGNHLKFPVYEFNPFTESNLSLLKGQADTFLPGSDRGDLISMYAIIGYHQVFGCASCRSTRWPKPFKTGYDPVPAAFLKYIRDNVTLPKNHKIYFAYGTELLDPNYKPTRQQVNKIMKIVGYKPINWFTKGFPGASHTELAWSTRFYISLMILLGK